MGLVDGDNQLIKDFSYANCLFHFDCLIVRKHETKVKAKVYSESACEMVSNHHTKLTNWTSFVTL